MTDQPRRFRKRPVEVEAMQWTGRNFADIARWSPKLSRGLTFDVLLIETPEGVMRAEVYDWIIKGVAGEFYPCKPEIFEATYEACTDCESSGAGVF